MAVLANSVIGVLTLAANKRLRKLTLGDNVLTLFANCSQTDLACSHFLPTASGIYTLLINQRVRQIPFAQAAIRNYPTVQKQRVGLLYPVTKHTENSVFGDQFDGLADGLFAKAERSVPGCSTKRSFYRTIRPLADNVSTTLCWRAVGTEREHVGTKREQATALIGNESEWANDPVGEHSHLCWRAATPITVVEKETGVCWVRLIASSSFPQGSLPAKLPPRHL